MLLPYRIRCLVWPSLKVGFIGATFRSAQKNQVRCVVPVSIILTQRAESPEIFKFLCRKFLTKLGLDLASFWPTYGNRTFERGAAFGTLRSKPPCGGAAPRMRQNQVLSRMPDDCCQPKRTRFTQTLAHATSVGRAGSSHSLPEKRLEPMQDDQTYSLRRKMPFFFRFSFSQMPTRVPASRLQVVLDSFHDPL